MNDASVWVHNLDPFLVQFTQSVGIRWYGLAYLTGFIEAGAIMMFLAKRGRRAIKADMVTDYITYCVLGVMIGGRFGYALFYSPDLLTDFSGSFPFWGVLRVWEGGMASHGGIIGVFVAGLLFAKRHKLDWRHLGDLVVLGGSVGIFLGRIANFINGELFGRPSPAGWPFAVKFPGEMFLWLKHDKEKIISDVAAGPDLLPKIVEAARACGIDVNQLNSWIAQVRSNQGARYYIQNTINTIIEQVQNGNNAAQAALGQVLTPRYPSQLYEAALEGLLTFAIAFWFWRKPRKPGVVGSLWLTVYAVVRIIGEHFRMPDAEIGFQMFGLTRGQWLSIGQLVICSGLLWYTATRKSPVISGWGPEAQALRDREP